MWKFLSFLTLGLLIGNITAMSASPISLTLTGLLFTFAGGSAFAFSQSASSRDIEKNSVEKVIFAFALGSLLGIYTGIYVMQHKMLSPTKQQAAGETATTSNSGDDFYLRNFHIQDRVTEINQNYKSGFIDAKTGYDSLFTILNEINDKQK